MNDSTARIVRTVLQFVAGGGLTVAFDQLVSDIPASYQPYVVVLSTLLVTIAQNMVEEAKGSGILRPASPPAKSEVEPVAQL